MSVSPGLAWSTILSAPCYRSPDSVPQDSGLLRLLHTIALPLSCVPLVKVLPVPDMEPPRFRGATSPGPSSPSPAPKVRPDCLSLAPGRSPSVSLHDAHLCAPDTKSTRLGAPCQGLRPQRRDGCPPPCCRSPRRLHPIPQARRSVYRTHRLRVKGPRVRPQRSRPRSRRQSPGIGRARSPERSRIVPPPIRRVKDGW